MAVRRIYRVSDLGRVGPVEGLDDSTVLAVSAALEVSWVGGHLDLSNDVPYQRRRCGIAQEIRDAFSGTSLSAIQVFDSLDVPDSSALRECAVQVQMTSGPSWESSTVRRGQRTYEFRDPSAFPG